MKHFVNLTLQAFIKQIAAAFNHHYRIFYILTLNLHRFTYSNVNKLTLIMFYEAEFKEHSGTLPCVKYRSHLNINSC